MTETTVSVETAAEGILEALNLNGIDYVFGSPGSDDVPFWNHLEQFEDEGRTPGYVQCRHEKLAVDMARGYAMMTGDPQVVKLHVTVGPLNAALGIWGAYASETPMVILSSYVREHEGETAGGPYDLDFHQPGGHENNFQRYLKWMSSVETSESIADYVARAVRLARSSPGGPTMLTLPKEVPFEDVGELRISADEPAAPTVPSPGTLSEIAEILESAERPVAIAGGLGSDRSAVEALVSMAERLEMGVFETPKLRHSFPMDHPLYLGNSAYGVRHRGDQVLEDADAVFVVDSPIPWYPPRGSAPDADVVFLGTDPVQQRRANWGYPADVVATGDSAATLPLLLDQLSDGTADGDGHWRSRHDEWRDRWADRVDAGSDTDAIDPFRAASTVDELVPDDAIVVNETIDHGSCVSNLIDDGDDRRYLSPERENAGGLGSGLGLALGSKLAEPDRTVTLLTGDGSFNYNPVQAAFGAIQEHDLPILVVIFNNEGYQVMSAAFAKDYPDRMNVTETHGTPITPTPDYALQAEAWGAFGETVTEPDDVRPTLERALEAVAAGRPALVDLRMPSRPIEDHP
ncbi:thiamine pyrophosphate-dependent enzyme [Natrarchaeobius oligotrophus]|uniref:Thiamine pyrophosphate-binding protein n=1 Tax=Natrarchaeobius chitinivorans TaxID=1679083 RepID=A0A3N6MEZ4_NATCH|nr:thiamine pyrophosphate-dependent enzyme [Natrarchaeobius chitinivorans]RQG99454.1 hypothetical protein EA472_14625 [Natrarchaeobius chitinivorans]